MKWYIWHFTKWQIHPLISAGTHYWFDHMFYQDDIAHLGCYCRSPFQYNMYLCAISTDNSCRQPRFKFSELRHFTDWGEGDGVQTDNCVVSYLRAETHVLSMYGWWLHKYTARCLRSFSFSRYFTLATLACIKKSSYIIHQTSRHILFEVPRDKFIHVFIHMLH